MFTKILANSNGDWFFQAFGAQFLNMVEKNYLGCVVHQ